MGRGNCPTRRRHREELTMMYIAAAFFALIALMFAKLIIESL